MVSVINHAHQLTAMIRFIVPSHTYREQFAFPAEENRISVMLVGDTPFLIAHAGKHKDHDTLEACGRPVWRQCRQLY